MQTPSDLPRHSEWTARQNQNRQSVFGNYRAADTEAASAEIRVPNESGISNSEATGGVGRAVGLQAQIDVSMARSFLYRFVAKAYEDPSEEGWTTLAGNELKRAVAAATLFLALEAPALGLAASELLARLQADAFDEFLSGYLACFGHAARGRCPLNEIEYGDIKADPLFQPHRLADLAAFYNAFGMTVGDDAHERQDHIALECEFMCVLAAKEAYALEYQLETEQVEICHDAQKKFLREHLGRWAPAFARRLQAMAGDSTLGTLATFTGAFVAAECARFGVAPGSEDLLLRPADPQGERLCASCGPAA
jgi:putative dimethyl sulfoxide reductase chaperone